MAIFYYSKECGTCKGSQAVSLMKTYTQEAGINFQERRTIFWDRFEKEAEEISNVLGVNLPFFYNSETNEAIEEEELILASDVKAFIRNE